jgi:hypothetical protein
MQHTRLKSMIKINETAYCRLKYQDLYNLTDQEY